MKISSLRSPYDKVEGIYYFGRMLDKIRLQDSGQLPEDYRENLGSGFDGRCVEFLKIKYPQLAEQVKLGGSDKEIMQWCCKNGRQPSPEEIEIWNGFMRKRGWRDEATQILQRRLKEGGFESRPDIQTMFDNIDLDEEREFRTTY